MLHRLLHIFPIFRSIYGFYAKKNLPFFCEPFIDPFFKISVRILLNIMFHAPTGRFQLELINYFTYFSPSSHPTLVCFFPVGLLLLIQHFQQVLWVLKFLLSPGTHKTCWKCCINNKRPTGKKHTSVGWEDGEKIGKNNMYYFAL